jgi:hypothetical protein
MSTLAQTAEPSLYRLAECQDIMADACVCDDTNRLVFLSLWGRDTAVQQFLARLELSPSEDDRLDQFHLVSAENTAIPVGVPDTDGLKKITTRAYQRTLFGSLVHSWLFDFRCIRPDKANSSALSILPKGHPNRTQRIWSLVQDTCPLPLLSHWSDTVLELLMSQDMLLSLPFALGQVEGIRIKLDVEVLKIELGNRIRSGILSIHTGEEPHLATRALDKVA